MFLMVASLGDAFNGLVLIILRRYPLSGFKGTLIKFLRVKLFGIGLWLIRNYLSYTSINEHEVPFIISNHKKIFTSRTCRKCRPEENKNTGKSENSPVQS
jgi:hypothetical protein